MGSKVRRGVMIVIEGADRIGKSTQTIKLADALNAIPKRKCELIKFPDRSTPIGHLISQYLKGQQQLDDHVIHLLFSANRWEHASRMTKQLASGVDLVIDRYAYSGVAYSSAKNGMDFDWCKTPDNGLPRPDVIIYLDMPKDASVISRNGYGDERYEMTDFQENVKRMYRKLMDDDNNWRVIPADGTVDDLHREILKVVNETIAKVTNSNDDTIKCLWNQK